MEVSVRVHPAEVELDSILKACSQLWNYFVCNLQSLRTQVNNVSISVLLKTEDGNEVTYSTYNISAKQIPEAYNKKISKRSSKQHEFNLGQTLKKENKTENEGETHIPKPFLLWPISDAVAAESQTSAVLFTLSAEISFP